MNLDERPSVCTFDCPDTCSLTVTVEDERIVKVRGSHALPFTDGVICNKVARDMAAFVHGPDRLLYPLRRSGPKGSGQFTRTTWDEALDEIHARVSAVIDRWGPQAVAPLNYAGPHGLLSYDSMSLRFMHRLGASHVYRRSLCGGVRSEAWSGTYGAAAGAPPEIAEDADLIIVWGNNATVANLHLVRCARHAMRKGATLVVIDPLRTTIAAQAALHVALMPGTDVVLAFALAAELERMGAFDQDFIAAHVFGFEPFMGRAREWTVARAAETCGVPEATIRELAQLMVRSQRLVLAPGNGLERGRNGGSGIRAAIALPALLGKLGGGSGIVLGAGNAFRKTMTKLQRPDLAPPETRTLNLIEMGRHLATDDLDPPLRAVFIYNHNPIVVHPEQNLMRRGLAREDIFYVGIEVAMTESMAHCDIILPAATHFECDDLYASYGHQWLQRARPVIAPQGESLPNTEIFRRLAARFGFTDPCFADDDLALMDQAIDPEDERLEGTRPSEVPLDSAVLMAAGDGKPMVLFDNVRPATPSGKIELELATLAEKWGEHARLPQWRPPVQSHPLRLISPASDKRISSTLGGLAGSSAIPSVRMHPVDAAARGLTDGAPVLVFNDLGRVELRLALTEAVPRGVVASEKGAWLRTSPTGQTISALVRLRFDAVCRTLTTNRECGRET